METKVAKTAESIGGLSFFACTLFARKAKKEEEAKQITHENHTAEHSQKYAEARPRKVLKMSPKLVQNVVPEAPFWLSEGTRNAHEGKVGNTRAPNSSWRAAGVEKKSLGDRWRLKPEAQSLGPGPRARGLISKIPNALDPLVQIYIYIYRCIG